MSRFWKILSKLIYVLMGSAVVGWMVLLISIDSAPTIPDPAMGKVVEFNNHGTIHYITQVENVMLHGLIPILFLLMFVSWNIPEPKKKC